MREERRVEARMCETQLPVMDWPATGLPKKSKARRADDEYRTREPECVKCHDSGRAAVLKTETDEFVEPGNANALSVRR